MRQEWVDSIKSDIREKLDPMYQNSVLSAVDKQIDQQPRPVRMRWGAHKGQVKDWVCTHCGFSLSEVYWKYCPNCGVPLPDDWANKGLIKYN